MTHSTIWWLIAGGAIVLELVSGTIYLLLLGAGFAAAAIAAHAGASLQVQLVVAAVVGASSVLAWYLARRRSPADPPTAANRNVNLDIGEQVMIDAWNADGTASVRYRGAQWTAVARAGVATATGAHRVAEVVGNRLVVDHV
ncbi:NfeD family protein [Variovorax dokdonensis]|uniref:NfeD family protein n=1 Tax=Variovorax dokdonensis TaxID=344883 RepID=A0ABT7NH54_9BURK|nr:NfeD family protein [Variovorax dokdonensis]MDM0047281.1 NfeD family protein [Variovorax dokdonensis]